MTKPGTALRPLERACAVALVCVALSACSSAADDEPNPNLGTGGTAGASAITGGQGGAGAAGSGATGGAAGEPQAGMDGTAGTGGEPEAGAAGMDPAMEMFPPSQQLDRGLLEYFGNVEDPKRPNASNGGSLWVNVYSIERSRTLVDIGLAFQVDQAFTAQFAVYESATRDGTYTSIYESQHGLLGPDAMIYYVTCCQFTSVPLEAGKFYAIGVMVGDAASAGVYANAPFSEGHELRGVSFGEQIGALDLALTDTTSPPDSIAITEAETAGRRFATSLVTR
jgi:hypothetical protein